MTVPRLPPGQMPTAEQYNQLARLAAQGIVGGEGIKVERSGNQIIISLGRRDRGIWTGITDDQAAALSHPVAHGELDEDFSIDSGSPVVVFEDTGITAGTWLINFQGQVASGPYSNPYLDIYADGAIVSSNAVNWDSHIYALVVCTGTITVQCRAYLSGASLSGDPGMTHWSAVGLTHVSS